MKPNLLLTVTLFLSGALGSLNQGTIGPGSKDRTGLAPTDLERIKPGSAAPDFTLESKDGSPIRLSDYRGRKNVVLVFYRGHW
jgi:cytochrome oxidase Cu insertion factor (SCO1/SenC/PrrC family)